MNKWVIILSLFVLILLGCRQTQVQQTPTPQPTNFDYLSNLLLQNQRDVRVFSGFAISTVVGQVQNELSTWTQEERDRIGIFDGPLQTKCFYGVSSSKNQYNVYVCFALDNSLVYYKLFQTFYPPSHSSLGPKVIFEWRIPEVMNDQAVSLLINYQIIAENKKEIQEKRNQCGTEGCTWFYSALLTPSPLEYSFNADRTEERINEMGYKRTILTTSSSQGNVQYGLVTEYDSRQVETTTNDFSFIDENLLRMNYININDVERKTISTGIEKYTLSEGWEGTFTTTTTYQDGRTDETEHTSTLYEGSSWSSTEDYFKSESSALSPSCNFVPVENGNFVCFDLTASSPCDSRATYVYYKCTYCFSQAKELMSLTCSGNAGFSDPFFKENEFSWEKI